MDSTIIAKKFATKVKINPLRKSKFFRRRVIDELKLHFLKSQARNAVNNAWKFVHMKKEDQFKKIWNYCFKLIKTNPNLTICVQTIRDIDLEGWKTFTRMYVFFEASKKGFLRDCRPIIGIDRCFLKGPKGCNY